MFSLFSNFIKAFIFCAINNFLRNNKILTPRLFEHNYAKGVMIIEDFGDLTFNKVLFTKKNKSIIYKKLVDLLLKIQKIKPKKKLKTISSKSYVIKKYSMKYLEIKTGLIIY